MLCSWQTLWFYSTKQILHHCNRFEPSRLDCSTAQEESERTNQETGCKRTWGKKQQQCWFMTWKLLSLQFPSVLLTWSRSINISWGLAVSLSWWQNPKFLCLSQNQTFSSAPCMMPTKQVPSWLGLLGSRSFLCVRGQLLNPSKIFFFFYISSLGVCDSL